MFDIGLNIYEASDRQAAIDIDNTALMAETDKILGDCAPLKSATELLPKHQPSVRPAFNNTKAFFHALKAARVMNNTSSGTWVITNTFFGVNKLPKEGIASQKTTPLFYERHFSVLLRRARNSVNNIENIATEPMS